MIAYVAGPYRADSIEEFLKNITSAHIISEKLLKLGYTVICPHKNTLFIGTMLKSSPDPEMDKLVMNNCKELVKLCDFVVLTSRDYKRSEGTMEEIKFAKELGKPVYISYMEMCVMVEISDEHKV